MQKNINFAWLDGKVIKVKNATVNILSHCLHYGSGAFEGIRCYYTKKGPAIFRLDEHIKRLYQSCKALGLKIPYSPQELKKAIKELIKKNKLTECYIRPIVFYAEGKMGLNPRGAKIRTAIFVWPWPKYLKDKVKVMISDFIRLDPRSVVSTAKICGYYVNSIFATCQAQKKGYDEAILLDWRGHVAEGPGENIFIVKKNILYTPKPGCILLGITRDSVIKIAKNLKIKVIEKDIKKNELFGADEIFFTGTAAEITPVYQLNNKKIKVGPLSLKLKEIYQKVVKGEEKNYLHWLTFVK